MTYVDMPTLVQGRSHIGGPHSYGIRLKTEIGKRFYHETLEQFKIVEARESLGSFLLQEKNKTSRALTELLDNDKKYKMDDKDKTGWKLYHELHDRYITCEHFIDQLRRLGQQNTKASLMTK